MKVTGAFGDISVRGGTLIPVKLYLGDVTVNNYMLVEKVKHIFSDDHHTMDLTLDGTWEDDQSYDVVSKTVGEIPTTKTETENENTQDTKSHTLYIKLSGLTYAGTVLVKYYDKQGIIRTQGEKSDNLSEWSIPVHSYRPITVTVTSAFDHDFEIGPSPNGWCGNKQNISGRQTSGVFSLDSSAVFRDVEFNIKWVE